MEDRNNKRNLPIIILTIVAIAFFAAACIAVVKKVGSWTSLDDENNEANVEETDSLEDNIDNADNIVLDETAKNEDVQERLAAHHLVCVPAEYMSLRASAGLGDDVITNLYAGTTLSWDGEQEVIDDSIYYYVKVDQSGQQGYVAAKYCVEMDYLYDEDALDIVQVSNPLYTYEDMVSDLEVLTNKYDDFLSGEVVGKTVDGRDIYEVTLGNPNAQKHVMLQASIHGREYMNTQLVMKLLEYYCYYYQDGTYKGISYSKLFDKTAFHLIPMSNPDGVTISQLGISGLNNSYLENTLRYCYENDRQNLTLEENTNGDYSWTDHYKDPDFDIVQHSDRREITFEEYLKIWKANANGVDLNNNFDAGWYDIDLKWWPSYGSFKGDYPVSEPETEALVECALKRNYECFVSYHSMGQLIYYDVAGNSASNSQASNMLASLFQGVTKYEPVNTNKAYNVNLGGFGDWIQLELDCPSITIESGKKPCPLESSEFPGIWNRHRETWAMLAEEFYR